MFSSDRKSHTESFWGVTWNKTFKKHWFASFFLAYVRHFRTSLMGHSQDLLLLRVPTVSELVGKLIAETGKDRKVTSGVGTIPSAGIIGRVRPQQGDECGCRMGRGKCIFLGRCKRSLVGKGKTASAANSFRENLGIRLGIRTRERSENMLFSEGRGFESCTGKTSICMGKRLGWVLSSLGMGMHCFWNCSQALWLL